MMGVDVADGDVDVTGVTIWLILCDGDAEEDVGDVVTDAPVYQSIIAS